MSNKEINGAKLTKKQALTTTELARLCDPAGLPFEDTAQLPELVDVIGQPRAFRALSLGSEVQGVGYNIFVMGVPDSGRTTLTRNYLKRKALQEDVPDDWCYIHNFDQTREPKTLRLPAGMGHILRKDMQSLIETCKTNLPKAFMQDDYKQERDRQLAKMNADFDQEVKALEQYVQQYGHVVVKTPYGLFLAPLKDGKPIEQAAYEQLAADQKEELQKTQKMLAAVMEQTLAKLHKIEQNAQMALKQLEIKTTLFILTPLFEALTAQYAHIDSVLNYLKLVQNDIVENIARFRPDEKIELAGPRDQEWETRYKINVIINNSDLEGAPVIFESQPTYQNLLGTIEHEMVMGASYTDFTKIRPGALHRANGGYLILPARDVLINPYAWEGLKRVLRDGEIRIVELASQIGLVSATSLDPEPIPLSVKIIMVGTPTLYYLLRAHDEDFAKLFKIRSEFTTRMERDDDSELEYAKFIRSVTDVNNLLAFDRSAVAAIIDHGARMVEEQDKLSTQFGIIADLVCEADYWARKEHKSKVDSEAVWKTLEERIYRSNLIEERIQEMILDGTLNVSVEGKAAGVINALSVISLGDYAFGRPNRVSAMVYAGPGGVVDIERQAKLGGRLHTKGVLIISGYIGANYGQVRALNLTASLTFEQSYDEIEGDSASAAELLALLSALSGIPIDQGIAITGSVNQHGEIQAIGGVNEKVEGFFDICRMKGLNSKQGVIIPKANQKHLMLKKEVREAVAEGKFHIWTVGNIAQAAEMATGYPFGMMSQDGTYPEGSLNWAVVQKLESFSKLSKAGPVQGQEPKQSD